MEKALSIFDYLLEYIILIIQWIIDHIIVVFLSKELWIFISGILTVFAAEWIKHKFKFVRRIKSFRKEIKNNMKLIEYTFWDIADTQKLIRKAGSPLFKFDDTMKYFSPVLDKIIEEGDIWDITDKGEDITSLITVKYDYNELIDIMRNLSQRYNNRLSKGRNRITDNFKEKLNWTIEDQIANIINCHRILDNIKIKEQAFEKILNMLSKVANFPYTIFIMLTKKAKSLFFKIIPNNDNIKLN